jgi:adenosine deaminase
MLAKQVKCLPKVELHLHIDGSLSSHFVEKHANILNLTLPCAPEELSEFSRRRDRSSFGNSLKIFDFFLQFLQTPEALEEATLDLCNRLKKNPIVGKN